MAYKIAISTSDDVNIDLSFGAAKYFLIYEVDGQEIQLLEKREVIIDSEKNLSCGDDVGCTEAGWGCGGGNSCQGGAGHSEKISLIEDCRCLICKKIGFQVQKQLERKAITYFDIECTIEDALGKITSYLYKMDHHESFRGMQK